MDDFGKDDFIWARRNFFAAAFAAFVLWAIVILQTVLTRWYVSQTAFEQAFAKSDIMKASTQEAAADTRNINSNNRVMEGVVNGRLNASEQQTMADKLFSSVWRWRSNEQQFR